MIQQRFDNICAISTPQGSGAISVIRVSGEEAISITEKIFSKKISDKDSHTAHFGLIKDGDVIIDEVVVTIFKDGKSFTGEDVTEIACHASSYIQQRILDLLLSKGCRMAEPGEFSMRAFFNKKMDLSQAEAIADLIASNSEAAHKMAMHQMRGGFAQELNLLRQQLIDFSSLIELELDFSQEDVEFADRTQLEDLNQKILLKVNELIESFSLGNAIKNGVPVAILGPPNAGKSTLLNVLLKEDKAIVSDIAGTTRDVIEDVVTIEGIQFRFIDTAGLRETTDKIESLGIERSYSKAKDSSLILYMISAEDLDEDLVIESFNQFVKTSGEGKTIIPVINKSDLLADSNEIEKLVENPIIISAKNQTAIQDLQERLIATVNKDRLNGANLIVSNVRHLEALRKTKEAMSNVVEGMHNEIPGDLLAMDIRQALHYLGEITGQVTPDDLLGNIFGKFCIGK